MDVKVISQEERDPVSAVPVMLAGIATTIATLVGIYFLNLTGFHLMGFLLWYVVPVGAIAVGALSGSGYCLAQWKLNLRVSWGTIAQIALVSLAAYFTAHYITYRGIRDGLPPDVAAQVSFVDYLRMICENVSVKSTESGSKAVELGKFGYAVIFLEMAGFCLGATIPSLILRGKPYCGKCRRYLRKHASYVISSTPLEGFKKLKRTEKKQMVEETNAKAVALGLQLAEGLSGASRAEVLAVLEKARVEGHKKALATVRVELACCPDCDAYHAAINLAGQNADGQALAAEIVKIDGSASAGQTVEAPAPAGSGTE